MVFLLTDILLFILFFLVIVAVLFVLKNPLLKEKWLKVINFPIAASALIIFLFYLTIGILDSIHFKDNNNKYSIGIYSLLDKVIEPALVNEEKTYSTPFSYQQFSKEFLADGSRWYPHLKNAAIGITNDVDNILNIVKIFLLSLLYSLTPVIFFVFFQKIKKANILKSLNLNSKKAIFWTLYILIFLIIFTLMLIQNYHIFGTDKTGMDVFYKAVKSIRTGLVIGTLTTFLMLPIAITLGILAGYFKGFVDDIIQYIYTTINSIPSILLIAALVLLLQIYMDEHAKDFASSIERSDVRLLLLCIILGMTSWTGLCRIIRSETLKLSELEFIQAAKVFGVSNFKIMFRHLLPNLMHLVLITIVLDFSGLVLAEAILSYIGIGVDPDSMSWGNMINSARFELSREPIVWWPLLAAFIFMFGLVLSVNLFADKVRKVFDTKEVF